MISLRSLGKEKYPLWTPLKRKEKPDTFHINPNGTLGPIVVNSSAGVGAFSGRFAPDGKLIVSETGSTASAISSYTVNSNGMLITEAIGLLSNVRREEDDNSLLQPTSLRGLPDHPRLAFILRLIIRSSEAAVAKFLNISLPSEVQGLVKYAIDRLSEASPISASTGQHDA
jgi:hypothetical protein